MYELNNKVRLIDVSSYPLKNADEFVGFICGIISQDHDLEQIYLDSFLKYPSWKVQMLQVPLSSWMKSVQSMVFL